MQIPQLEEIKNLLDGVWNLYIPGYANNLGTPSTPRLNVSENIYSEICKYLLIY